MTLSKLAEKIRKATRLAPQPLGFGTSRTSSDPTMVLAGIAPDAGGAADLAARGADVVIIGDATAPAAAAKPPGDAITGARIAGRADNEAASYREAGFDFVVFDADAAATSLLDEEVGYVISLPDDLTDNDLRTLEAFQLDAVDVGAIDGPMTVRRQIALRRIYATTRKPLMATVSPSISGTELQALRDTNVIVVAIAGADNVERLRKAIDALPPRHRRKEGDDRPTPLVPRTVAAEDHEHEDDD
jgi:hypothetical protein